MSSWRTGETRTRCFCSRRRTLRWALEGALGIEAAHDIMPIAATHSHAKQRTACNRCNLLHELSLSRCTAQHAASRFEALNPALLCVQMQRSAVPLHAVHHVSRCIFLPRGYARRRVAWWSGMYAAVVSCRAVGLNPSLANRVRACSGRCSAVRRSMWRRCSPRTRRTCRRWPS